MSDKKKKVEIIQEGYNPPPDKIKIPRKAPEPKPEPKKGSN